MRLEEQVAEARRRLAAYERVLGRFPTAEVVRFPGTSTELIASARIEPDDVRVFLVEDSEGEVNTYVVPVQRVALGDGSSVDVHAPRSAWKGAKDFVATMREVCPEALRTVLAAW